MKQNHINILKQFANNDLQMQSTLLEYLSDTNNPLTFEELSECFGEKPPLSIKLSILYNIGIEYNQGKGKLTKNNQNAFKIFEYVASKNHAMGCHAVGFFYYRGLECNKNDDMSLIFLLKYVSLERNKGDAIKNAYKIIGKLYFRKEDYNNARTHFYQYYRQKSISVEDKKIALAFLLDCYLKTDSCTAISTYTDLNWDTVREFIQKNAVIIQNNPIHFNIILTLLKCPKEYSHRMELIDFSVLILKKALLLRYPLANNEPTPNMNLLEIQALSNQNNGWTTHIADTLLDGYNRENFIEQITHLENEVSEVRRIELELEEAKEEGDSDKNIATLTMSLDRADTNASQAKEKLAQIKYAARRKEIERQYYVQSRFFDPSRTHKSQTKNIAEQLQSTRLGSDETIPLVENVPARRIITAERSTIEASKNVLGLDKSFPERNQLGWIDKKTEFVKLNESTNIQYYQNPGKYPNHLGNFFITIPGMNSGDYAEIFPFLQRITQSTEQTPHRNNEKKLASYMLRYAKSGTSIMMEELKEMNSDATEQDLQTLNIIFYHIFVKEIARRMPCGEDKYDFPSAIITARAIQLIEAGHLSIKDVFSSDAPYGVVTGKLLYNNHENVILKINRVNRLYNQVMYQRKYASELSNYFTQHPKADVIASRKQLRKELQESYGGDSDTDGDGYSSSEDNSQKKTFS